VISSGAMSDQISKLLDEADLVIDNIGPVYSKYSAKTALRAIVKAMRLMQKQQAKKKKTPSPYDLSGRRQKQKG